MNENNLPDEETRFHRNMMGLIGLLNDLISSCWESGFQIIDPSLVSVAESILTTYDKKTLICNFIEFSEKYWNKIKDRDESFFIDNAKNIFGELSLHHVNLFSKLFTTKDSNGNNVIGDDDRKLMWNHFDSFVKISIKYIHKKREFKLVKDKNNGGVVPTYGKQFYKDIPIRKYASIWKIKLEGLPDNN